MSRAITQTLIIRHHEDGPERDRYGNPIRVTTEFGWPVYALAPGTSAETGEANRDAVTTGATVYAPRTGPLPHPHDDVVTSDGTVWAVIGNPATWERNPHGGIQEGVVVLLERKEG